MKTIHRRNVIRLGVAAAFSPLFRGYAQESGEKRLGVALLGLGDYATKRLGPALKETSKAKLVGIVTGSPDKIPKWQQEYEIKDGNIYNYQNFDSIADNKEIDVVYVVTPTALHPEFAIRAAQAGKHVICEKPMAPTTADCIRMIDAAKKAGVTLQIGYRLHWDPYHQRLMEAVSKKEFGKSKSISTANGGMMTNFTGLNAWRIDKELGIAGALYDLGVYAVQAALYSAGANPVSVTAKHFTKRPEMFKEVPETYEWVLEFPGGLKAEGMSSYGQSANHVRIETEKGLIEIAPAYGYSGQKGRTPEGPMNFPPLNQQAAQIDGQIASILSKTPSLVPGEMGARDIQVINGIVEAAATGNAVKFGKFLY